MALKWIAKMWRERRKQDSSADDEIILKLDPWLLACAVGAMNGSMYGAVGTRGIMDFDVWILLVNKDKWRKRTGKPDVVVEQVLRRYAEAHRSEPMEFVLRGEEKKRGKIPSIMLRSGESVDIGISVDLKPLPPHKV